jgi:hypothetical protein
VQDVAEWAEVGQRVCVIGRGTAMTLHSHPTVVRITKTMVVTAREVHGRPVERRYRRSDGYEVGMSEYGGSTIHRTCQRRG